MVNAKTRPHGDHFNTIRPGMHKYIEWLGGPERLAQLQVLMDNAEQQLPACPFCGAPTVLRGRWMYASSGVQAECSQCHCGTQPLFQEKTVLNRYYSLEEQIERMSVTYLGAVALGFVLGTVFSAVGLLADGKGARR